MVAGGLLKSIRFLLPFSDDTHIFLLIFQTVKQVVD